MSDDNVADGKLIRSSSLVSLLTMVSRAFGLLRDVVIANVFGAGAGADAFLSHCVSQIFFVGFLRRGHFLRLSCQCLQNTKSERLQGRYGY